MARPMSREGSSQITQACAARCTHPGHPHRSSAPHPPSPTGERQRPGSEGHSHPQGRVKPGMDPSVRSRPGSWAALGRAKLLLLSLPKGPFFSLSCPFMHPQYDALSFKCSCLTVPQAQQLLPPPLLAAPTSGCCSKLLSSRSSGCWQQQELPVLKELPAPWHCGYVLLCQAATGSGVLLGCPCCCLRGVS